MADVSISIEGRQRSRRLALQALYQWLLAETSSTALIQQFFEDEKMDRADTEYFRHLVMGVMQSVTELETELEDVLDRPFAQLDPVEKAALLIGAHELIYCHEIPYRVVINEAVELAKTYGATDGHRYVNAVMDRLARKTREIELRVRH